MLEIFFNPATNKQATPLPDNPLHAFRGYLERPVLIRELTLELMTMILEMEADGETFLGRELRPQQLPQIQHLAMQIAHKGTTFLVEGAPGTGKTLVLGMVMRAMARLQMRGLMNQPVIYAMNKPLVMAQQTFSPEHRKLRIRSHPTLAEVKLEFALMEKYHRFDFSTIVSSHEWKELRARTYSSKKEAAQALLALKYVAPDVRGQWFDTALRLLMRTYAVVHDVDGSPMVLPLLPVDEVDEEQIVYSGDISIPPEYTEQALVLARKGIDMGGHVISSHAEFDPRVRVVLTTVPSVLQKNFRRALLPYLQRAGAIFVDDARSAITAFQDACIDAGHTGDWPLVFAKSALSTTNGMASRPHAEVYVPRITIEEAMESISGKPQILPNVGVDVFPSRGPLYPLGTEEALQQLMHAHFEELDIPQKEGMKQPYMATTLFVTTYETLEELVHRLRAEYAKRNIPACVVPLNTLQTSKSNTLPPASDKVLE